jgi:hypothetical protein
MVNRVVPRSELDSATRELATQIAAQYPFTRRMAERAVNQTLDIQGFTTAVQAVFDVHTLGHWTRAIGIGIARPVGARRDEGRGREQVARSSNEHSVAVSRYRGTGDA